MARTLKRLTARFAATVKKPGRYADGGGLYLNVRLTPAGGLSRCWEGELTIKGTGKKRYPGFGSADLVSLAEAREAMGEYRAKAKKGVDPLEARKAAEEAEAARKTFGEVAEELIEAKRPEWRNAVHAHQWALLEKQAATLWSRPVDSITTADVLAVLKSESLSKTPETASRVRGRIEMVLDAAKASGLRTGENPAQWKGNLAHLLPRRQNVERTHHAAMNYHDVPAFVAELRKGESVAALALEFCILTAARSGEVIGACWSEVDLENKLWVIPASKMKSGREHRVPLCGRAVEIVERLAEFRTCDFVFAGHRRNQPIGKTAMNALVPKGLTVHGMRSAFRDFAGNETNHAREVCESALAHSVGNTVEAAYRRSDALEKRRALMESWMRFIEADESGNVLSLYAR
jgi:integrase